MIKRQFYSIEHRSRDDDSSSSESDSESEVEVDSEVESDSNAAASPPVRPSFDSEQDSSENEDEEEDGGPGRLTYSNEDDTSERTHEGRYANSKAALSNQWADLVEETLAETDAGIDDECVVRCKNVLKCRWCPKTICLSNETMQSHLMSKKHARSLKLMENGKLKVMLNSDGEEEEQGETHAERHARTIAAIEHVKVEGETKRKKQSGRQRQRKRAKLKASVARAENKVQLLNQGRVKNKSSDKVLVAAKTYKKHHKSTAA